MKSQVGRINITMLNDVLDQDKGIRLVASRIQGLLKYIVVETLKI